MNAAALPPLVAPTGYLANTTKPPLFPAIASQSLYPQQSTSPTRFGIPQNAGHPTLPTPAPSAYNLSMPGLSSPIGLGNSPVPYLAQAHHQAPQYQQQGYVPQYTNQQFAYAQVETNGANFARDQEMQTAMPPGSSFTQTQASHNVPAFQFTATAWISGSKVDDGATLVLSKLGVLSVLDRQSRVVASTTSVPFEIHRFNGFWIITFRDGSNRAVEVLAENSAIDLVKVKNQLIRHRFRAADIKANSV
ncbi:hypothetical protein DFJ74DRAFT_685424 [Hyaloraphidium curvatum]|nr:hypothetical protein DFJ74DRAFT_685424 [Hyaloraphidium curvatum]